MENKNSRYPSGMLQATSNVACKRSRISRCRFSVILGGEKRQPEIRLRSKATSNEVASFSRAQTVRSLQLKEGMEGETLSSYAGNVFVTHATFGKSNSSLWPNLGHPRRPRGR